MHRTIIVICIGLYTATKVYIIVFSNHVNTFYEILPFE